jgi:hypothetical protein
MGVRRWTQQFNRWDARMISIRMNAQRHKQGLGFHRMVERTRPARKPNERADTGSFLYI